MLTTVAARRRFERPAAPAGHGRQGERCERPKILALRGSARKGIDSTSCTAQHAPRAAVRQYDSPRSLPGRVRFERSQFKYLLLKMVGMLPLCTGIVLIMLVNASPIDMVLEMRAARSEGRLQAHRR